MKKVRSICYQDIDTTLVVHLQELTRTNKTAVNLDIVLCVGQVSVHMYDRL